MSEPRPRYLTDHKQNDANEQIALRVGDEPGQGGACHEYHAYTESTSSESGASFVRDLMFLSFQKGPIKEFGVNGTTHEVMLAVLIDRLRSFQAGEYACRENALALTKLEEALMWLHKRTAGREARGVEGTHEK